jgi:hypothetical protein
MSSTQYKTMAMHQEEYAWEHECWRALGAKDSVQEKLLDANVACLLGLGFVPIIVGIATGIWPMTLVGLGPWLLAWLDISQRKRGRMQKEK